MLTAYQIERVVQLFPFFAEVSTEEWEQASVIRLEPSTGHSGRSGRLHQAAFVLEGSIRIHQLSESGREVTLYRVSPGEGCVLMMASILGETEYGASAEIETTSELLLMEATTFKRWSLQYNPIAQFIYSQFLLRMQHVTNLLDQIAFKPIDYRIADYLLLHTSTANSMIRCTHDQIAIELGTAREVVSRMLKEFERAGYVSLGRSKIVVVNRRQLEAVRSGEYVT